MLRHACGVWNQTSKGIQECMHGNQMCPWGIFAVPLWHVQSTCVLYTSCVGLVSIPYIYGRVVQFDFLGARVQ